MQNQAWALGRGGVRLMAASVAGVAVGREAGTGPGRKEDVPRRRPARVGRIRDRATFQALGGSPCRVQRGPIRVTWVSGGPGSGPRVAYAIGRKVGGAVERNRVRRRLRVICTEASEDLRPGSYLIRVSPGVAELSFRELRGYVHQALTAMGQGEQR